MQTVVSKGKSLLSNWGTRPAQGNPCVSPVQGNPAMAPKKVEQFRPPVSVARRKTSKSSESAPAAEAPAITAAAPATTAPASRSDAFKGLRAPPGVICAVVKPEGSVKKEKPPAGEAPAPPPPDSSAVPPPGELQRMTSALKYKASKGDHELHDQYKKCTSNQEKRSFYYNSFLPGNPIKETSKAFKRQRESEKVDSDKNKDWGWVSRDFVAGKLELQRWREIPAMRIELEHKLSKMDTRPCEFADKLEDHMDKKEYRFIQTIASSVEVNKKRTILEEDRELDQDTFDSAMQAIDGLDAGKAITAGGGRSRGSGSTRRPSPEDDSKRDPPWLATFKKECTRNFQTQKRAAEQTLTQAEQCIRLVEEKPKAIKNNDLLTAYFKTVKEHKQMLKTKDHEAAQFFVKNEDSQKPATEAEAKAVEKLWKDAANDIKAAKSAFASACLKMLADLRSAVAKA